MSYLSNYKVWFSPEPTRSSKLNNMIDVASNRHNGYQTLMKSDCDKLSSIELMQSYIDDNTHIRKTAKREARYGEFYLMSIAHHVGMTNLLKTVREFIYEVTYGYNDLPYVVLYKKHEKRYLIHIWIADREWVNQFKVYDRDYWFDAATGKPSNSTSPNSILKCTKGEPKLNASGERILITWSQRKVLIFNESYADTLPRFYDAIEAILIRVKNTIKNKFSLTKNKEKKASRLFIKHDEHRDKQHTYREIASLQYYIQQSCYKGVIDTFDYKGWEHDKHTGVGQCDVDILDPYGKIARNIVKLFYKYRERIRKGSYHTESGVELSLFKGVGYKQALINAQFLRTMFKKEIHQLLN